MSFDTLNNALALFTDNLGNKWFKAKVKTNVDPDNLDRIQVELPGMYDPDLGDVPWCGPMKMSPFGFGQGYGVFGTPVPGSDVLVTLQGGDPHYPMYMHIQCWPNPSEFPSGTAWGWKDPDGNALIVQGKDIQFKTGGGWSIHITATGDYTVTAPAGATGTYNVPTVVWNCTDFTINASNGVHVTAAFTTVQGIFDVNGDTNINTVTISSAGAVNVPTVATFTMQPIMTAGLNITGGSFLYGTHDLGPNHKHTGGTLSGGLTGTVST